ncbi:hypothetical protein GQ607_000672 [Colletotrichum asianum]|uniref:Uncharacterized protein n=1 Tax=Colletotrichum asianum TaxID=702518 RepID=A0A8H3WQ81_9PEZI|nr:hypothetical protein GQ607_000672 [Colletotrichum asianum]
MLFTYSFYQNQYPGYHITKMQRILSWETSPHSSTDKNKTYRSGNGSLPNARSSSHPSFSSGWHPFRDP